MGFFLKSVENTWQLLVPSAVQFRFLQPFLSLQLIQAGKGEALRIRAILRSLVPIEDLVGVISLPVQIPAYGKGQRSTDE